MGGIGVEFVKQASLGQLGGGGFPQQSLNSLRESQLGGFLGLIGKKAAPNSPAMVSEKPDKKDNFAEAMIGNIKRKFREDL